MSYLCYSLDEAAQQLGMSETVLFRLSQFLKVPASAYGDLGYISFKGDLTFSDSDIGFFRQVKDRLLAGENLEEVKQRIRYDDAISDQSSPKPAPAPSSSGVMPGTPQHESKPLPPATMAYTVPVTVEATPSSGGHTFLSTASAAAPAPDRLPVAPPEVPATPDVTFEDAPPMPSWVAPGGSAAPVVQNQPPKPVSPPTFQSMTPSGMVQQPTRQPLQQPSRQSAPQPSSPPLASHLSNPAPATRPEKPKFLEQLIQLPPVEQPELNTFTSEEPLQKAADKSFQRYKGLHRPNLNRVFQTIAKDLRQPAPAREPSTPPPPAGGSGNYGNNDNASMLPDIMFEDAQPGPSAQPNHQQQTPWQQMIESASQQPRSLNVRLKSAAQLLRQQALSQPQRKY